MISLEQFNCGLIWTSKLSISHMHFSSSESRTKENVCQIFDHLKIRSITIFGYAGSCLLCWLFSSWHKLGLLSSCIHGLLTAAAGLVTHGLQAMGSGALAPRLWSTDSIIVGQGLSCSEACGIFPCQWWNQRLLHWQARSLPLSHQGSPDNLNEIKFFFISI